MDGEVFRRLNAARGKGRWIIEEWMRDERPKADVPVFVDEDGEEWYATAWRGVTLEVAMAEMVRLQGEARRVELDKYVLRARNVDTGDIILGELLS